MSSVLLRNRSINSLEFFQQADAFRTLAVRTLLNDKYVPKHFRFVYSYPIIKLTNKMIRHMRTANDNYPVTEKALKKRKKHAKKALRANDHIQDLLQSMLDVLYYKRIDALHPLPPAICEMIEHITDCGRLTDAWRRKMKLIKSSAAQDFGALAGGDNNDRIAAE